MYAHMCVCVCVCVCVCMCSCMCAHTWGEELQVTSSSCADTARAHTRTHTSSWQYPELAERGVMINSTHFAPCNEDNQPIQLSTFVYYSCNVS